jgi:hypothetical protein
MALLIEYNGSTTERAMKLTGLGVLLTVAVAAAAATRPGMLVSTDWLSQHLSDPKFGVLHVSTNRTAYDTGYVPGACFVPHSGLVVTRDDIPNELPLAAGVSDDSRSLNVYWMDDRLSKGNQSLRPEVELRKLCLAVVFYVEVSGLRCAPLRRLNVGVERQGCARRKIVAQTFYTQEQYE